MHDAFIISENTKQKVISIYPVPASDVLTINFNKISQIHAAVKIYSMDGKEVINTNISETLSTINTSDLSNGMYLVYIENNGMKVYQQKLMIAH